MELFFLLYEGSDELVVDGSGESWVGFFQHLFLCAPTAATTTTTAPARGRRRAAAFFMTTPMGGMGRIEAGIGRNRGGAEGVRSARRRSAKPSAGARAWRGGAEGGAAWVFLSHAGPTHWGEGLSGGACSSGARCDLAGGCARHHVGVRSLFLSSR